MVDSLHHERYKKDEKMLEVLAQAEKSLPKLLRDPDGWNDIDVDYHPPRVERLWRPFGESRIYLHRIHPCEANEALFHPHPWPSAMLVISGNYEMAMGYGVEEPPMMAEIAMVPGSRYAMIHPDAWHYVRPIDKVAYSLMVSGQPWQRKAPKSDQPLQSLTPEAKNEILEVFRSIYS